MKNEKYISSVYLTFFCVVSKWPQKKKVLDKGKRKCKLRPKLRLFATHK